MRQRDNASRIDSATVELWRDRRETLHRKLTEDEQTEWAWLWRTRLSVLDYLIHRYDNTLQMKPYRNTATRTGDSLRRNRTGDSSEESVSPYNQTPVHGTSWIADQKREKIKNRLSSLHRANVERHAKSEKIAEALREVVRAWQQTRRLSPQREEPEKSDTLRLAEALQEPDEREYKELRSFIAFDLGLLNYTNEPLDDETIHLILTEHGIVPDEPD